MSTPYWAAEITGATFLGVTGSCTNVDNKYASIAADYALFGPLYRYRWSVLLGDRRLAEGCWLRFVRVDYQVPSRLDARLCLGFYRRPAESGLYTPGTETRPMRRGGTPNDIPDAVPDGMALITTAVGGAAGGREGAAVGLLLGGTLIPRRLLSVLSGQVQSHTR